MEIKDLNGGCFKMEGSIGHMIWKVGFRKSKYIYILIVVCPKKQFSGGMYVPWKLYENLHLIGFIFLLRKRVCNGENS